MHLPAVALVVLCSLSLRFPARDPAARQEPRAGAIELPPPLAEALGEVRRAREAGDLAVARAGLQAIFDQRLYADLLAQDDAVVEVGLRVLEQEMDPAGVPALLLEVREERVERWSATMEPDHLRLLFAKEALGVSRYATGDAAGARALFEEVLEARARLLAPDDPTVLRAMQNLVASCKQTGDLAGARELEEAVLDGRRLQLPADHPDVLVAQENLAATLQALGDLASAQRHLATVLEARTRLLPADHPDLLRARYSLGSTRRAMGDFTGARDLWESVLEAQQRLLPAEDLALLATQANVALTRQDLGDVAGAREVLEGVLATLTRIVPPEHPQLLRARVNLARARAVLGDLAGARELEEAVVATWMRLLHPDHPDLLHAMVNLAATRSRLGDYAGAQELMEVVLEARARLLPADHPKLLEAQLALAATLEGLDGLSRACELEQAVVDAYARSRPAGDPERLAAQSNLFITRRLLGDLEGARELGEVLLAAMAGLPPDHPLLLKLLQNLAWVRMELGDADGARELALRLLEGVRRLAEPLRSEALRSAREGARAALEPLFQALLLSAGDRVGSLEAELFATLEELRLVSVASAETAHALAERPELAQEARRIAALRSELNDLVAAGPDGSDDAERWREELVRRTDERDRAERGLRAQLAQGRASAGRIEASSVGARLARDAAAVSFLRVPHDFAEDQATGGSSDGSVLAFVVRRDGAVRRVELGSASELEALVHAWRAALGRPLETRGLAAAGSAGPTADLEVLGRRLRERVLDPVLSAADGALALHVVLDDVLHLVPLDALPLGEELVGERITIHHEVTLARLLRDGGEGESEGHLLLAGGLDYDALGAGAALPLESSTPPLAPASERAGSPGAFVPLAGTLSEVESIARLYEATFEREPGILRGAGGTKAALQAGAPGTRFLHLATHGWFASESFRSQLDSLAESSARRAFERAEATLAGFAPETLCGLALAGANRGKDPLGRVPGILTAEELATFDLRGCALAVLSACETNVGIRRAGQGIQSLQAALHAAGARTAITSLWKVDDAATRRLFELFYAKLWKEGLGKSDALWQAKMALRAEGHAPRDWAGWVLSGDPE